MRRTLDTITRKWWFLALLFLLYFVIPSYTTRSFDPRDTPKLIIEVFSNAPLFAYPAIMPVFKVITILLIAGIVFLGDRVTRVFHGFAGAVILLSAWLQNMAVTEHYGFAILTGNVVVFTVVAFFWIWEAVVKKSDFSPQKPPLWKYWVVPLAFLAFWEPVSLSAGVPTPDFNPLLLLTSDAAVTFCMAAPVYLAVLVLFYPKVNHATLRVTSFAGVVTALLNVLQWFVFEPSGWWMGILHIPLLSISIYAFVLALQKESQGQVATALA
jgi:hypothetical protein